MLPNCKSQSMRMKRKDALFILEAFKISKWSKTKLARESGVDVGRVKLFLDSGTCTLYTGGRFAMALSEHFKKEENAPKGSD